MKLGDKQLEKDRYDAAYSKSGKFDNDYIEVLPNYLKAPYKKFSQLLRHNIEPHMSVLEVGAGSGIFAKTILEKCGQYLATDISPLSLELLNNKLSGDPNFEKLSTRELDIESPDLPNDSFDAIVSCGALSYGDNRLVLDNFKKLLKPGGVVLVVDSLDHNPFYRLNRFVHYLKGNRTLSTLQRMPTMELIESYKSEFTESQEYFFGALAFTAPFLKPFLDEGHVNRIVGCLDERPTFRKHAFKFVLVARK